MGRWYKEDLLISVDLNDISYCNGAYGAPSNLRVAAETGYDANEFRFHFFVNGEIAAGEDIIYN